MGRSPYGPIRKRRAGARARGAYSFSARASPSKVRAFAQPRRKFTQGTGAQRDFALDASGRFRLKEIALKECAEGGFREAAGAANFAGKDKSSKYVPSISGRADISVASALGRAYSLAPERLLVGFSHPRLSGARPQASSNTRISHRRRWESGGGSRARFRRRGGYASPAA